MRCRYGQRAMRPRAGMVDAAAVRLLRLLRIVSEPCSAGADPVQRDDQLLDRIGRFVNSGDGEQSYLEVDLSAKSAGGLLARLRSPAGWQSYPGGSSHSFGSRMTLMPGMRRYSGSHSPNAR